MSCRRFWYRLSRRNSKQLGACITVRLIITFFFLYGLGSLFSLRVVGARFDSFLFILGYFTWKDGASPLLRLSCVIGGLIWGVMWQVPLNLICALVLLFGFVSILSFWNRWVTLVLLNFWVGIIASWLCLHLCIGVLDERVTFYEVLINFWNGRDSAEGGKAYGGGRPLRGDNPWGRPFPG